MFTLLGLFFAKLFNDEPTKAQLNMCIIGIIALLVIVNILLRY